MDNDVKFKLISTELRDAYKSVHSDISDVNIFSPLDFGNREFAHDNILDFIETYKNKKKSKLIVPVSYEKLSIDYKNKIFEKKMLEENELIYNFEPILSPKSKKKKKSVVDTIFDDDSDSIKKFTDERLLLYYNKTGNYKIVFNNGGELFLSRWLETVGSKNNFSVKQ